MSFLIYSFLLWFSFLNLRQNVKGAFLFVFSLGGLRHLQNLPLFRDNKKNKKRKKKVFPFGAKASRFRFRFFAFGGIGWSGDGGKTERMYAPLFSRKDGYTDKPCHTAIAWRFPIPRSFRPIAIPSGAWRIPTMRKPYCGFGLFYAWLVFHAKNFFIDYPYKNQLHV